LPSNKSVTGSRDAIRQASDQLEIVMADGFEARSSLNQRKLRAALKPCYDFIVCGAGSAGSVVARRLAENPDVSVLLLEAGGSDDVPEIINASSWPTLRSCPQNWLFKAAPNPHLNGRSIPMAMGKVLGGGSSINVMVWSRGHRNDWDYFAAEAGDDSWNYQSVLQIYRRIENWSGPEDPARRGRGGLQFVQPAPDPSPLGAALLEAFAAAGIPVFADQNGAMMEGGGGAAITNVCVEGGQRRSVFRAYVHPYMDRPNLTVLPDALVAGLTFDGRNVKGVAFRRGAELHRVEASREVVLSLGAIHTPKLLMQSGIGDEARLSRFGIRTLHHLPGVGSCLQDHFMAPCVWEAPGPVPVRDNLVHATAMWKSDAALATPDLQCTSVARGYASPEAAPDGLPPHAWSMTTAVMHPASRGRLNLTGPDPNDPIEIHANFLDDPADLRRLKICIEFIRDIGRSAPLRPFVKREILPGLYDDAGLEAFMRNGTVSYSHQSCTARMGRDARSVVDHRLRVHGVGRLRIADASILPRITTGNTMAPCVVIGERTADMLKVDHAI
jgi:choline dehydrogenase